VTRAGGFFQRQAGRLDPHRYTGFHELLRDGHGSLMVWTNLSQGVEPVAEGASE
jgi:hypothetical protein